MVIYECTVSGGLSIVWRGGAFHCTSGVNENEITLLNNRQSSSKNVSQVCNNGDIYARSIKVENTSYGINHTSQLNVTLTSVLVNSTIECIHDDGTNGDVVGSLNITAGKLLFVNLQIY